VAAIDDVLAGRQLSSAPASVMPPTGAVPPPRVVGSTAVTRSVARPPVPRRRSKVAMVLLPFVALLAGAGIAAAVLQALSDQQPASTASAAEQRENGSIVLDADNYIGLPVDEVADKLTALGLTVQLEREETDDAVPDRVTGIDPDGEPLEPGDVVTVTYAVAPDGRGDSRGGSAGVTGAAVDDDAAETEPGTGDEAAATTEPEATDDPGTPTLPADPTTTEPTEPTPTGSSSSAPTTTTSAPATSTAAEDPAAVQ
jgi:serine/threonine-protein kinase